MLFPFSSPPFISHSADRNFFSVLPFTKTTFMSHFDVYFPPSSLSLLFLHLNIYYVSINGLALTSPFSSLIIIYPNASGTVR